MSGVHRLRRGLMSRRAVRASLLVFLVAVVLADIGGAAHAFWHSTGTGTGSGTTATTGSAVTLSPGTPTASLFPGGHANVVLNVSNPNTAIVHLGSLALDPSSGTVGFAVDAGHSGCATSTLSFTAQTNAGAGWTVPAKAGSVNGALSITLTNALGMDTTAANACQGATFVVYMAVGP
jgi:hypothetical protein